MLHLTKRSDMFRMTWMFAFICLSATVCDVAWGLSWPWGSTPEPRTPMCPEECTCESAVMHCAHRKLKAPPKGRWPDVWILHLENNSIQWLAHDALVPFPELREIHLCLNNLVELDLSVFGRGAPLLASLYATENAIDGVSGSPSRRLPLLARVDLSRNRLHVPPSLEALSAAAPSLLELYLAGNPLNSSSSTSASSTSITTTTSTSSSSEEASGGGGGGHHEKKKTTTTTMNTMAMKRPPMPVVSYFPTLRVLDISATDLKDLDQHALIGVPQVESLNLANNSLSRVGNAIRNMRHLTELDLSYNDLTTIQVGELPKFRRLQYLWLVGNPIAHVDPLILEESLASAATVDACGTLAACSEGGLEDLRRWAAQRSVRVYAECDHNATRVRRGVGQGGFSW